jgi:ligand-binding sensor domain-containing protein/two-component sensor histidine kinase
MDNWYSLLVRYAGTRVLFTTLIFLLGLLQPLALWGQFSVLPQEYYSVDDGLSDRNVVDIVQSEDGMLWLATTHGLNRFDGYETLVFNHFPNSEYRIAESNLRKLYLDKAGNLVIIYATTYGMFEVMNPITFEREVVQVLPQNGVDGIPRKIMVNHKGEILVLASTNQAINIYQYAGDGQFDLMLHVEEDRQSASSNIDFVHLLNNFFLITDQESGLRYYSPAGKLLYKFKAADFTELNSSDNYPGIATVLHQDKQGRIWYSLQKQAGIFNFQIQEDSSADIYHIQKEKFCTNLWEDGRGNVLLSWAENPSREFPLKQMQCISTNNIIHDFDFLLNSASKFIVCAFSQNFFGTMFLGIDTGLKIIQNRRLNIDYFLAKNIQGDTRGAVMRGISSHRNKVYFAREFNDWYVLDLQDGLFDTLPMYDRQTGRPVEISCSLDLQTDQQGKLWGVTCTNGNSEGVLIKYDPISCLADTYPYDHRFTAFTIASDGKIWLCAEQPVNKGKLLYFDPAAETYHEFLNDEGINPIKEVSARFILEASDKIFWVGTLNGLYKIDPSTNQSTRFLAEEGEQSLSSNAIYALHEDANNNLWIGTTNGFNIFDPRNKTFELYSQKDGLASNIVCGFIPVDDKNYWIATYNGLSYFDYEKKSFRNFFSKDGLTHDEFNRFSYYKGPDGRIYLGGVNGINIFNTEDLLTEQVSPRPILSKITRYNVKKDRIFAQYKGLSDLRRLTLLPSDNYFSIHLTMPNFVSPRRNLFKAWLEGYDKNWTLQSKNPVLTYNKLPPGDYTLHIKGSNAYSDWSEEELLLTITVEPAFYETLWFSILCILGVLGILYIIFQYRLEQKLKMERIRTRLSSDLHDEVSGLLSGIAMQSDVLLLSTDDPSNKEKLSQIGEVSRKALSKMSDVIWSIDSRKDRVEELIKRMQEHSNEILTPLDIAYRLNVSRLELQQKLPVTLRQNLYFIFKEAINNVAKHSGASIVEINLRNDGNQFIMSIQDNGRGLHRQNGANNGSKKSGQGLSNLKMRAYRIDAELHIIQNEKGFEVVLKRKKFA